MDIQRRQNGYWTYSTMNIKVLYIPKNFYASPNQISGYAPDTEIF